MEMTVVREVLCDIAISLVLNQFWVISTRNLTLFARPFLARRHTRAGHETSGYILILNKAHTKCTSLLKLHSC